MLEKLKKIDLRNAWKHEALDFTNWLAEEENIAILSDEIGTEIKVIQTEAKVGNYNVDILAEDATTSKKIIIENQLESTDHDHLGKIITYASGHDAEIIIWIVKKVREEHRQAVDWLNEHTDEKVNIFAIELELYQIGESPFAPKFQVVSRPNDWAKTIKSNSGKGELTNTKLMQLEFWEKFNEFLNENSSNVKIRKASPQHWMDISFGTSFAHISLTINTQQNLIGCEVYIDNSKELFEHLFKNKDKIESDLGMNLVWMGLEGKKASRIKTSREGNIENQDEWKDYFKWMQENTQRFQKVFGKYVKDWK